MSSERTATRLSEKLSEPFLYIPSPGDTAVGAGNSDAPWNPHSDGLPNIEQREKEAFDRGFREGEGNARKVADQELLAAKSAISVAIEKFKTERESYFARIEPEIVQLALAIARKILHREAQMDPLLLAGLVRVALEKLDAGTRVRLWAHPADISFWNEHFGQAGAFQPSPELVGDPALRRGECALESEMGSTQISLETQLKEIEQGFFDLLDQRPRVR
jgi:flagellar assembly protein FliH